MRCLPPLVAALLLLVVACAEGDGGAPDADQPTTVPASTASGCTPARTAMAGGAKRTLTVGGEDRSYLLHVPSSYDGASGVPVVVAFHGFALTGEFLADYTLLSDLADAEGFITAYPDAVGTPAAWNDDLAVDRPDDVAFATAVLNEIDSEFCINENAVFMVGYSNGGGMAQRLACLLPDRIAGLATVAATYVSCRAPVPWVAFHGVDDPLVPFEGGENPPERGGGTFLPARRVLSDWSRELGCDALAMISRPADDVELSTFPRCTLGDGEVQLYSIIRGGHTWPGAYDLPPETVGATTKQIDATKVIWDFFVSRGGATRDAPSGSSD